jgi:hypothetical protein
MLLRAEKVDIYTIALWLGHYAGDHPHIQHESTKSTEIYLHADNQLKTASDRPDRPDRAGGAPLTGLP